VIFQERF